MRQTKSCHRLSSPRSRRFMVTGLDRRRHQPVIAPEFAAPSKIRGQTRPGRRLLHAFAICSSLRSLTLNHFFKVVKDVTEDVVILIWAAGVSIAIGAVVVIGLGAEIGHSVGRSQGSNDGSSSVR